MSRIGLSMHPSVSLAMLYCLRFRLSLVTTGLPCPFLLQRDLFAGLASVCLLPLACSCLFCRFADGRTILEHACVFFAFISCINMPWCVFRCFYGLVLKMAPSSRGLPGVVMDGRPYAKNFVMGSLQLGQGGCSSAPFPSW